jgi:glycosyltransferase involved in cell wall biosynthesis
VTKSSASVLMVNTLGQGGGTDEQCLLLSRGLRELGIPVRLLAPKKTWIWREAQAFCVPTVEGPKEAWKLPRVIQKLHRHEGFSVLHAHHGRDYWFTVLAARALRPRSRVVLSRHLAKSPPSLPSRLWLLGLVDGLVAVSGFVGRVLTEGVYDPSSPEPERRFRPPLRGDHAKIRVICGGIDPERFTPGDGAALRKRLGLSPEDFLFGLVGSADRPRGKGQLLFLEAAARLAPSFPHVRYLLVGRGTLLPILEARLRSLGLSDRVTLFPYVEQVEEVYRACDCLVHPGGGTEAFGLVIAEAFACGTPVIAASLDGIPEAFALGREGKLIRPDSLEELLEAMRERIQNGRLSWEKKQELHRRVSESFSYQQMARRTAAFYGELLPGWFSPGEELPFPHRGPGEL